MWTNTTCENGLQPKWGLGGGLVWPSSSSIVTLWEFFLLIWILEACTRSIFLNLSTLQCNFFPGSAFVSQFPTFWGIGNPTDFQVSWGTWLIELMNKGPQTVPKRLFFIVFINGGGSNPFLKNLVPLLFCSVGRLKSGRKTTENRQKMPKTAQKTTETGTNLYKKRPGGGFKGFL